MGTTNPLAIYGMSGHGKVLAQIAISCGYDRIVWIDDRDLPGAMSLETFLNNASMPVALGIGNNFARQRVFERLKMHDIALPTLVHPSAVLADDVVMLEGTVVMPLAVINAEAHIAQGVIINTHVTVEHECRIGAFVHLSPNVALGGAVSVGDNVHVGIGSSVIQCVSIGSGSVIAAGASVISNVPNAVMAAGVPAIVKKKLQ